MPLASKSLPLSVRNAQSLRKRETAAEKALWEVLRNRKFHGLKFRRQAPFGKYIVDFLCMDPQMIIEVDGAIHQEQKGRDADRTKTIQEFFDIPVIRFTNKEVLSDMKSVLKKVESYLPLNPCETELPSPAHRRGAGGEAQ